MPAHFTKVLVSLSAKNKMGAKRGASPPVERQLLVKDFVLGTEDDVGALSPVFCVRSERVDRLRCSHFVQEGFVEFLGGSPEDFLVVCLPVVAISLEFQQLPE